MSPTPICRGPRALTAALLIGLLVSGCEEKQAAQAPAAPPPPQVGVLKVQPQNVPLQFEYAGRTAGSREIEVRARVGGILQERTYVEGQRVEAGKVLFRIDPEPFKVALQQAEARLKTEQAVLRQADRTWARVSTLYKDRAVSGRERDEAQSSLETSRAGVALAEAEVRAARINLDYTTVTAPIDGVTSREALSEGSLVGTTADNSLLTRITQLDPIYVNFAYPDAEAAATRRMIDEGTYRTPEDRRLTVRVRLGDGSLHPHAGFVDFTDSVVDPQTGTIRVRATVPNPDETLLPGQFVRVIVEGISRPDSIAVPERAVMQGPQGAFLYAVGADGKAQVKPVKLGLSTPAGRIIDSGIAGGERVVVEGVIKVRPGQPVKAVDPGQLAAAEPKAPSAKTTETKDAR
ncbi:membrane fusion protein (multidrug efflux system) [Constrictibacter sp. MBR-5]|jgi:membrane fusion protein (multidrug efflux system)|uniref:efflux RND transporter periplasmic adaptor subunit n=1 Tax=Constrictibacter sp. MBR-5 TaxID=3156467 RepID=UPI003393D701